MQNERRSSWTECLLKERDQSDEKGFDGQPMTESNLCRPTTSQTLLDLQLEVVTEMSEVSSLWSLQTFMRRP